MFSGIVEELGEVVENGIVGHGRLRIAARAVVRDVAVGESISVNGCCLTVIDADAGGFTADVMPETARRTTLDGLSPGDPVNLEAALAYGDRVGGHMVTGHVDAVGTIVGSREEGNARWTSIAAPPHVIRHLVEKGCVAVDGVSLTVVSVAADRFTVSLIPHTVAVTTARGWQAGRRVNLEVDLIARYVERSLSALSTARPAVEAPTPQGR
jgi:riboflavin synthase